jgi:glycosyltransferase involved in cell wall biosynthesis
MIEVRVPTFRRPVMLRRALLSLLAQTHQEWNAIVMDDSSLCEAESVVRGLADPRIHYAANRQNLGRVRNLNRAFRQEAFFEYSSHACVLEDDNWYDPPILQENLRAITKNRLAVLARNYRMVDVYPDGREVPIQKEPLRELYGGTARSIPLKERALESFFNFGLGNLCYFWDLNRSLDLSMEKEIFHVHVAETGRAVSFDEDCWYEPDALATFSRFVSKSATPSSERPANQDEARLARLSNIFFTRRLMIVWTRQLRRTIPELLRLGKQRGESDALIFRLAEAGSIHALLKLRKISDWVKVVKALPLIIRYGRLHEARSQAASQASVPVSR